METTGSLTEVEARLRAACGVSSRLVDERVELIPGTAREAARALSACARAGADADRCRVSLEAFARIDPPDPVSGTVRVGSQALVGEVDAALRGWGLWLGALTPRTRAGTVAEWLEGAAAGLRAAPGGHLETAALALTLALRSGGLWSGVAAPRHAVGPGLERLVLGAGGQLGVLLEATLRALPRPDVHGTVHASLDRAADVAGLVRAALRAEVPVAEVQVQRRPRGFLVDLVLSSQAFRARRDRTVVEGLVRERGELRTMRRVYEREAAFEGELDWPRLPQALEEAGTLGLYRLSRESLVVAAAAPVEGAVPLSAAPPALPASMLAALQLPERP